MLKAYKTIIFTAITTCSLAVYSQADSICFRPDVSVRYRFEAWDGMNAKNYGDNSPGSIGSLNDKVLLQRFIVGASWFPAKNMEVAAHMQDSRAFGWSLQDRKYPDLFKVKAKNTDSPYYTMNPNEEFLEIYDAFIEYRELLPNLTIKLGRQKIFYGDNHIFGPGDWGNSGRWTWDALKISYKKESFSLDLFGGGTKTNDPKKTALPFKNTEFWGGGLYSHIEVPDILEIEPFYAIKTEGSADYIGNQDINRQWAGVRLFNNNFFNFIFDLTAVKGYGNDNGNSIDSYGIFAKAGYQFQFLPAKPILSLRQSYASGGKNTDSKIKTFEPVFGAGDKYYGWMNIVSWANLDDREIVLELFPVKKMWVEIKYNWFYVPVPEDVTILGNLALQPDQTHLGNELNIFCRYQAFTHWQFTGLLGMFEPKNVRQINQDDPHKAFLFSLQCLYSIN